MRRDRCAVAAILLSFTAALAGCDGKPKAEDDEAARVHRDFQDALARRIDEIGRKLDELKIKAQAAAADQKENLRKLGEDLAVERDKASASLKELRETAAEKWEVAKAKIERAVLDLERKATEALK